MTPLRNAQLELRGSNHVRWRGRTLLYFGGCDYLRLSHHPSVHRSLCQALDRYGLNVAASRLTTGNHPLYQELENQLQRFFNAPTAWVVPTGYVSNLVLGQALRGLFTHVLIDARAHASLKEASSILDSPVHLFAHRDATDLAARAAPCGRGAKLLVMTDGMYAADGSAAPLQLFRRVLPASAWLWVDDAHGAGVLGEHGRGTLEHEKVGYNRTVQTLTLSKALGCYGGAILAPASVHQRILKFSSLLAGSTPFPLPIARAARQALRLLDRHPGWLVRLRCKTRYVRERLRAGGLIVPEYPGPIISLAPSPKQAARLKRALLNADVYPTFLRYPGGPPSGYFRFAISRAHQRRDLDRLASALLSGLA